jgi:hypothetical protein
MVAGCSAFPSAQLMVFTGREFAVGVAAGGKWTTKIRLTLDKSEGRVIPLYCFKMGQSTEILFPVIRLDKKRAKSKCPLFRGRQRPL